MTQTSRSIAPVPSPLADRDLETLLTIRHFELLLLDLAGQGKIRSAPPASAGQEQVATAIMGCLTEADFVLSQHRSHAHFLARHGDVRGLLAEILGKEGAIGRGVGGGNRIYHRNFLAVGPHGAIVPVAAGVALGLHHKERSGLAAAFIGGACALSGDLFGSLDAARLWSLPLVVVVESEPGSRGAPAGGAGTLAARVGAFGVACLELHALGVNEIREALAEPLAQARSARHPLVVDVQPRRPAHHGGPVPDHPVDPLDWYQSCREVDGDQFERIETRVRTELGRIAASLEASPPSTWSES